MGRWMERMIGSLGRKVDRVVISLHRMQALSQNGKSRDSGSMDSGNGTGETAGDLVGPALGNLQPISNYL